MLLRWVAGCRHGQTPDLVFELDRLYRLFSLYSRVDMRLQAALTGVKM
jgi:hypothetical protein